MKKILMSVLFALFSIMGTQMYAYTEKGKATYYGKGCTSKTASGERMSPNKFTCAHKTLPFGTMLKVTSTKTGESVIVKVNDRGPFGKGRIVDLSWAAAKQLGMLRAGVIDVTIETVETTE